MGMTVEAVDESGEVKLTSQQSKSTAVECGLKLAASVVATTLVLAEDGKHLLGVEGNTAYLGMSHHVTCCISYY
jgi:hypothetical protein